MADEPAAGHASRGGFIALIPARLRSTRLPDKPLADIGGAPMIVRVAQQVALAGARRVAVATDSERVAAVVQAAGFEVVMTREDHPTGSDRLAQAATLLELPDDEIVVNVQGDEPLVPPALVGTLAAHLAECPSAAIATVAHPIRALDEFLDPNVVKVVTDATGRAMYFSRAPVPYPRDAMRAGGSPDASHLSQPHRALAAQPAGDALATARPLRHVGIYAYRCAFLRRFPQLARAPAEEAESLEQLRAMWHGYAIAVMQIDAAPPGGVDTPADLERVRRAYAAARQDERTP